MVKHVFYLTDVIKTRSKDNAEVVKDLCLAVPKIKNLLVHHFDEGCLDSLEVSFEKDFIKSFDRLKEDKDLNLLKYDKWWKDYTGVRPMRTSLAELEDYWDKEKPDFFHVYFFNVKMVDGLLFNVRLYFSIVHPGQDFCLFATVFDLPESQIEVVIENTGTDSEMFFYEKEEVI